MVTGRLIQNSDACLLEINGETRLPFGYMSYNPQSDNMEEMRRAGIRLFFLPVYSGDRGINPESGIRPMYKGFCVAEGEYDFSAARELYSRAVGESAPGEIYIIPRLMLEPPTFWEKRHPEALARDFAGASVHECYSSEEWLSYAETVIFAFAAWLKESGFDEYTAGVHLACGHTEEFMRPITHTLQYTDYSAPSKAAWREYVKDKYGSAEAVSAAWNMKITSFDQIEPPTPALRLYTRGGEKPGITADYNHFHSVEDARAVCRLAKAAKRAFGQRPVGAFYGYCGCERGHTAVDMVLSCPDVDFLASPFSYINLRPVNLDWPIPGPLDSCLLHGKTWFMECDVRTHLSRPLKFTMPHAAPAGNTLYEGPVWYGPDSEEAALNQMKKAFAKCLTHGAALWWFDMWGGWYKTEAYQRCIERTKQVYEAHMLKTPFKTAAQIAAVYDMSVDEYMTGVPDRTEAVFKLSRCGAPFNQYELCDLELLDPDKFRALVLINARRLTEGQKAAAERWAAKGRSVILVFSSPICENAPAFEQTLSEGSVRVGTDFQIYSFEVMPEPGLIREALLTAGAHVFNYQNDAVYAGGGIVALTAVTEGEKRVYLPFRGRLTDVFDPENSPEPCEHYTDFYMRAGETRVFEY